jgi:GTP-sensing pleiotropic transcriptional regulator CodY
VSLGRSDRLGNELTGIALVASCFAERIDLTLVVVVDSVVRRLEGNRLDSRLVGVAGC